MKKLGKTKTLLLAFVCAAVALALGSTPLAQGGGEPETHVGDLFGDLYHVKRDVTTGQPILQKRWVELEGDTLGWDYCPIPVDITGLEIPFAPLSCDVDPGSLNKLIELDYFGRLSGARTKERNQRMHFDETIANLKNADLVTLDAGGRLLFGSTCAPDDTCASWKTIDSPMENLALYRRIMKYGHLQTDPLEEDTSPGGDPAEGTVYHPALDPLDWAKFRGAALSLLPAVSPSTCFSGTVFVAACAAPQALTPDDFFLSTAFLGGAADKHGQITVDLIQYLNRFLKITEATPESLATLNTLPALIRDENGVIAPAPTGLPWPASERFMDFSAARYLRTDRFSTSVDVIQPSGGVFVPTTVNLLTWLNFISEPNTTTLDSLAAFRLSARDALRVVEFMHEYEIPADLWVGMATQTIVQPASAPFSNTDQYVMMTASITSGAVEPVNSGTFTFSVRTSSTVVGVDVTVPVVNNVASALWTLPGGTAPQLLTILGTFTPTIIYSSSSGSADLNVTGAMTLAPAVINFSGVNTSGTLSPITAPQVINVTTDPLVEWTATALEPWVQIANPTGTGSGAFTVGIINPGNVLAGVTTASATITATATGLGGPQGTVIVNLLLQSAGSLDPAFGQVDTPAQGATGVQGAIAVTGWALDDVGVVNVKLYRNCFAFDDPATCAPVVGSSLAYLADAVFVAGARPDVEALYDTLPYANRAGWGLQILTNMLPNVPASTLMGGQGTVVLYAVATDQEGNQTLLGRSIDDNTPTTITLDNENIAKPFGVIDSPAPGEVVSGTIAQFGWALTPAASTIEDPTGIMIPLNGLTMTVLIDGLAVGKVAYNQCRGDVGNPVPAGVYCNDDVASALGNTTPQPLLTTRTSNPTKFRNLDAERGAIGAFMLDTTTLTNGLHTIAWLVTDSADRTEGIGSRFFIVNNADLPLNTLLAAPAEVRDDAARLTSFAVATAEVTGRTGFDLNAPFGEVPVDAFGSRHVKVAELGRLELRLGEAVTGGFLMVNGTLRDLPPGSSLVEGVFTWMPGPGYVGRYNLVFLRGGEQAQIPVSVTIGRQAEAWNSSLVRVQVDAPTPGAQVRNSFAVAGYAMDPRAEIGTGIDAVHVWAVRRDVPAAAARFLGEARLGVARPDVARAVAPQFHAAGFELTVSGLEPGRYDLMVFAWNRRTARWEDARVVPLEVGRAPDRQ